MPERRATRCWAATIALVMALGLCAGCVGVPTSGQVRIGRAIAPDNAAPADIHVIPAPPTAGMTRQQLVTGFLEALVSSDGGYAVARRYLAPGTSWTPSTSVTTYDSSGVQLRTLNSGVLRVTAPEVGHVDAAGAYQPRAGTVREQFSVIRLNGQWRINSLSPRLLLSTEDADRVLQPVNVYWLDPTEDRLVPQELLLNVPAVAVATTLVRLLLAGPPRSLGTAVRTVLPANSQPLGTVPVDANGVAAVNLPSTARSLSSTDLIRLSAQLTWTLRQVPGVSSIQLSSDGRPLAAPAVPSLQPISSWPDFSPDGPSPSLALGISGGHAVAVSGALTDAERDRLRAARPLRSVTANSGGTQLAGVAATKLGAALIVGSGTARLSTVVPGVAASAATIDPAGDVLAVVSSARGTELLRITSTGSPQPVQLPASVPASRISAVAVSSDGTRIALVAGRPGRGALVVGSLVATRTGVAMVDPVALVPAAQDARSVAWSSADQLVTTVAVTAGRRAVFMTDLSRYRQTTLSFTHLPADVDEVAAAPGRPILASDGRGIWSRVGESWSRISTAGEPSYAE